jgi:hypothetical protein
VADPYIQAGVGYSAAEARLLSLAAAVETVRLGVDGEVIYTPLCIYP